MNARRWFTGNNAGDGDGSIEFVPGNPQSPIVNPARRENPAPDFSKGIPQKFSLGPADKWGSYSSEIQTRDEGLRGLPLDYQPPHHKSLGLTDHKETTARRMMEALHAGDAAYFKGLSEVLRKFNNGKKSALFFGRTTTGYSVKLETFVDPNADLTDQDQEVVDAIRIAAQEAGKPPYQHKVLEKLCWASNYKLDKLVKHYLIPLGFGWLPKRGAGKPRNLP